MELKRAEGHAAALALLTPRVADSSASIDEAYLAGELSLEVGAWGDAESAFDLVLRASKCAGDEWYVSCARIGIGYARLRRGDWSAAAGAVSDVGAEQVFWLRGIPKLNREYVERCARARAIL